MADKKPTLHFRERVRLIKERLDGLRRHRYAIPEHKEPSKVRRAREICLEWDRREEDRRKLHQERYDRMRNAVKDALILGDTDEALRLIHEYEELV